MYGKFTWWQGVVEDRNDPFKLGRCRVRILGYHTDDKQQIPTNTLPWAMPIQPITSAAISGIGITPTGAVEGTWVFGFFRDGENAQEPVIFGTVGGKPEEGPNPSRGFNDPKGKYPLSDYIALKEPDTNRLARGIGHTAETSDSWTNDSYTKFNGENAHSLRYKRESRNRGDPQAGSDLTNTGIPKAVAGDMTTSVPNTSDTNVKVSGSYDGDANHYVNKYWNEPNPRYGGTGDSDTEYDSSITQASQYPYNHVRMSEQGHIEEWDDTKGSERLHRYHCTGTFEEIQPDGTRVVKVKGSDYEIIAGSQNVYVTGVCNLTINGDARVLYRGDLVQEVVGDYHLHVGGEMRTKIIGNDTKEVMANRKIVINGEDDLFVAKNQVINIADNLTYTVNKNLSETVKGNVDEIYGDGATPGNHSTQVKGKSSYKSLDQISITTFGDMKLSTDKNMNINVTLDCIQRVKVNSTIEIGGYQKETITSYDEHTVGGYFKMDNGGTYAVTSGGNYSVNAPRIDLN